MRNGRSADGGRSRSLGHRLFAVALPVGKARWRLPVTDPRCWNGCHTTARSVAVVSSRRVKWLRGANPHRQERFPCDDERAAELRQRFATTSGNQQPSLNDESSRPSANGRRYGLPAKQPPQQSAISLPIRRTSTPSLRQRYTSIFIADLDKSALALRLNWPGAVLAS